MFSSIELVTLSCQFIYAQQLEKKKECQKWVSSKQCDFKNRHFFNNMRINMY